MIKNKNIKFLYFNKTFNKSRLKKLIYWSIILFGEKKTVDLVEILKKLGYSYATKAGLSLSIDDLQIPLLKNKLLFDTESKLNYTNQDVEKGYLTSIEYFSQVIYTWNNTNDNLKQQVINNFKTKDVLNPVYMMAFSGARGNISQVRQLVGMRGLMADPSGRIIDFPIQSNFREGLTLTEYIISCYGARKGVVDTALRTATSGYLTRRLVDVAQHVIIRVYDCLTLKGIYLSDLKINNNKKLLSLKNRLVGRVLAEDVYGIITKPELHPFLNSVYHYKTKKIKKKEKLAKRNQEITVELINTLLNNKKPILVRSPLTCQDKNYVCQLCYGWSLSSNRLVSLGESVGIIAAQSIGEPGTQLTMRTFHTGGVFSGQSSSEIRSLFDGYVEFPEIINGKFVRTVHGQIAFLTKQKSFCLIKSLKVQKIILPIFTLLFVKQGQQVFRNQLLAEPIGFITELEQSVDIFQTIYSEFSGEIRFKNSKSIKRVDKINKNLNKYVNSKIGELWLLASNKQIILKSLNSFIKKGDFIFFNNFICLYNIIYSKKNILFLLNNNQKTLSFNKNKYKFKIFNFFNIIKKSTILNFSSLEYNIFIKYDYFQIFNKLKSESFNNNFKNKIYSNLSNYNCNKNTLIKNKNNYTKKTYFLSYYNLKNDSYGFIYKLLVNLNSINKLTLFENNTKNYSLPLICFLFSQISENRKLNLSIKNYNVFYFFKIPFNFIFKNDFIIKNKNFFKFYNLNKINEFNLNYKILFKLKNFKYKYFYSHKFNSLKKYNKIFKNRNIKKYDNNIYFFELINTFKKVKIKSYFYTKGGFNYNENNLFYNLTNFFYIFNTVEIFSNFNINPSYLLFNNMSLNFLILSVFYKNLYRKINNKNIYLNNNFKLSNSKNNLNKFKDYFNIYLNKKPFVWSFYFLKKKIKTNINLYNINNKLNNIDYNLFFYSFSNNIIYFYKSVRYFHNNNNNILFQINENYSLEKKQILLNNKIKFDKINLYLFKSNTHNLYYFNYFFLSVFEINEISFNFFKKLNDIYVNKSLFLFNKGDNNKINKKLFVKKNFFIYFKKNNFILSNNINLNSSLSLENSYFNSVFKNSNLPTFSYNSILWYFLFNINNTFFKQNLKKNLKNLLLVKNNKKLYINKKKFLYLNKKIIYFYFSSYIYSLLLLNFKLNSFNSKLLQKNKIKLIQNKNFLNIYSLEHNKNLNNNIKYNLIFSNLIFLQFLKNLNLMFNIFYNFLNKFNTKEIYFLNNKLNKTFFLPFSINNLISYNNFFIFLLNHNKLKNFGLLLNSNKFSNKNKKSEKLYLFLNKKNNLNFNISIIWVLKGIKLKNIYKLNYKNYFIYYNINNFKIKTKKFKILKFFNYNNFNYYKFNKLFGTNSFFNKPYLIVKNNMKYYFLFKNKKINKSKVLNKKNTYYKLNYFYYLFNKKLKTKITKLYLKQTHKNYKKNILNNFLINLIIYNDSNYLNNIYTNKNKINLNKLYFKKWFFNLNSFYIKKINKKMNLNLLYNIILINNTINLNNKNFSRYKNFIKSNSFYLKNNNLSLIKKYWINNYLRQNIFLFNKFNYSYDYWLFYKSKFNFLILSNNFFTNLNKKTKLFLYNYNNTSSYISYSNFKILNNLVFNKKIKIITTFPIHTLYLFRIQLKINSKINKISNILSYFSNNKINKNKNLNFIKFKFFYFKLKFILTKYNNIYIQNIFLINLNYILSYILILYYLKEYKFNYNLKYNLNLLNINNLFYKKLNKFIFKYYGWICIINKSNYLFLNSKKIILNGSFINNNFLFDNNITLNKFYTFRFKNIFLTNLFNLRNYFLKSFFIFKIKKNLVNSVFIFNGSKFFILYLKNNNLYLNNLYLKNNYLNIDNYYFFFTKFYFYKIKINTKIITKTNIKINTKINNIFLINNYYRIIFLQTSNIKKIKYSSHLLKYFFSTKKSLVNSNYLKAYFSKNNLINNSKRIFLINNLNIIFNNYSRYKPKLLIKKILFNFYNVILKFNKFKIFCLIEKNRNFNNLNNLVKYLNVYKNNKTLISQNFIRYYILKFPFNYKIKTRSSNNLFIKASKQKFLKKPKITYSNELLFNNKINLKIKFLNKNNINNQLIKYYFYFNQKSLYQFYNFFQLKGYIYYKNFYINKITFIFFNKIHKNIKKKYSYLDIIKKNITFFSNFYLKNNKILNLYIIKHKRNNLFDFYISPHSSIYFYKKNNLNNKFNSNIYIINKTCKINLLDVTTKFNINNTKSINSKIYINFKPFLIKKSNYIFQINYILKKNNYNNCFLQQSVNQFSINIFDKLNLIQNKIKKISNYNNYNNKKISKLNYQLSNFKGEVLKYNFYYSRTVKIKNTLFNSKKQASFFPEIFYLTDIDFLTYKTSFNNKIKFNVKLGEIISCSEEIILNFTVNHSGQIIFLNKNKILLRRAKPLLLSSGCIYNLKHGDFININSPLLTLTYKNLKTEDIVQGIPKIEQIFEARENLKDQFSLNTLIKLKFKHYKKFYSKKEAVYKSIIFIQQYIVDSVQKVYQSQGVNISDKHIEIIIKQMTSKVKITDPGNTGLLRGDIVYLDWIELINSLLKGKKSQYEPIILGISKACLEMDGFISAASFQETIKILSRAAILQKRDFLRGLKENLILGHLVPIGTGFEF